MKKIITSIVCAMFAITICSAQVNETSELRDVEYFNNVFVNGNIEVTILNKNIDKIMVKADADVIDHVVTEFKNNVLGIHFEKGYKYNGTSKISVTIPFNDEIAGIYASDDATIKNVGTLVAGDITLGISDESTFDGCIKAKHLNVNVTEHSICKICGEVKNCVADVASDSVFENGNLSVASARKAKSDNNIELAIVK